MAPLSKKQVAANRSITTAITVLGLLIVVISMVGRLRFVLPLENVAIALAGTMILALAVMLAPLHRAVRFKPGEALRYD